MPVLLHLRALGLLLGILLTGVAGAVELKQAVWVEGTSTYRFGGPAAPSLPILGAPADTDWRRWAMLHDGQRYRLYAAKEGRDDTLYQFAFDAQRGAYVFGHASIPEVRIVGIPASADPSSFAMLHDGDAYRLFLRDRHRPDVLHAFAWDAGRSRYVHAFRSPPVLGIGDFPAQADLRRWALVHDGSAYRLYALGVNGTDTLFQGALDPRLNVFRHGHESIPVLRLVDVPQDAFGGSAAMLHDGSAFRFYFLSR
jgi:hypothetical protein